MPLATNSLSYFILAPPRLILLQFCSRPSPSWHSRSWLPDPGYHILATKSWLPYPGFHILAFQILATSSWRPHPGFPDPGFPDRGFHILATKFWLPNPGYQILVTRSWPPNPGCHILAARSWLPDPGNDVLLAILNKSLIWGLALGSCIYLRLAFVYIFPKALAAGSSRSSLRFITWRLTPRASVQVAKLQQRRNVSLQPRVGCSRRMVIILWFGGWNGMGAHMDIPRVATVIGRIKLSSIMPQQALPPNQDNAPFASLPRRRRWFSKLISVR